MTNNKNMGATLKQLSAKSHCAVIYAYNEEGEMVFFKSYDHPAQKDEFESDLKQCNAAGLRTYFGSPAYLLKEPERRLIISN